MTKYYIFYKINLTNPAKNYTLTTDVVIRREKLKVPRIDTLIAKKNLLQTDRNMRIPEDLTKAVKIPFQSGTPDCDTKNERLNFLA